MSKKAYGTINVPWSIAVEANYDVIMDGIEVANGSENVMLSNVDGTKIAQVVFGESSEITLTATIKGSGHLGQGTLVNSLITDITDTDVPEPLIVLSNGMSKEKEGWSTCTMTCSYFGTGVTSGDASATIGIATTTTGA